jgi:sugar/nucleoside kinase (ribokinase family)
MIVALPGAAIIENIAELDLDYLRAARAIYIGPSYPEVAIAAAAAARESEGAVFCAPGGGWGPDALAQLGPVLQRVDVLLVSRAEAAEWTGLPSPSEAIRQLGRMGPPVVIQTLGAEGALVLANSRMTEVPAFPGPPARDTTGAGDAFAAGLVVGFLEGLDWEAAARMGCAVAALKIRHVGARSGLPRREEVQLLLGGPVQ